MKWRSDLCGGGEWLPIVRQQFTDSSDGMRWDTREHIVEPVERLNATPLAGSDEASQHRRCLAAVVASEERPVAAAQRDIPVGSLGGAVVDLQLAVFQKARQRLPLIQRIAHRRARPALRQNFLLQFQQILVKLS